MNIRDFKKKLQQSIFTLEQARRIVSESERKHLNISLSRWVSTKQIRSVKRGVYIVEDVNVNELVIAKYLYPSSYVSLETALNLSGILPDVTAEVTSVVTTKPRKFVTDMGVFSYSKISPDLYFGFELQEENGSHYMIAKPEKALLDLVYVRRIRDLSDLRVEWHELDKEEMHKYMPYYPLWVQKEVEKYV